MTDIEKQILSNQISIMGALGALMNSSYVTISIHNIVTEDLMARVQETQKLYVSEMERKEAL